MEKKEYLAPTVTVYGDVKEITKANSMDPTRLDATFPAGTPFSELTSGTS